jgi:signal transduction histidine kinase
MVPEASRRDSSQALDVVAHELHRDAQTIATIVESISKVVEADPEVEALLAKLGHAVHRLQADIEAFAARDLTLEEPLPRPVNLQELVESVIASHDTQGHPIDVRSTSAVVAVDPVFVERIVHNLLANALEHTPSGAPVRVLVEAAPSGVTITVEDQGPGIPDDVRMRVFEAEEPAPMPPAGPTGLWIVRHLAQTHGGDATVDQTGEGLRVRVTLPRSMMSPRRHTR